MAINTGLTGPNLRALIHKQHGVVSAAQAVSHGLSRETVRRRVANGIWQRPMPGVLALQSGPPSQVQWLIAAQLYAGEGSVLTGRAALSAYGVEFAIRGGPHTLRNVHALHALVPHRTRRQNLAHLRITRTTRVPQATRFGELRLAPPARSVLDWCLATDEDGQGDAVEGILTAALADGRVRLTELEHELDEAPRRHSGHLRSALAGLRENARAAVSSRLVTRLETEGPFGALPDVTVYYGRGRVARTAALWPTRAIAVVLDSPEQEIRALTTLGFAVIALTSQRIEHDLAGALRQIDEALRERPEATLPAGVSLLPRAGSARSEPIGSQRVLTAVSPARTGVSSLLPLGGTGQMK